MILSPFFIEWLFISGTTRGTDLSIRQNDELSITTVPFLAKTGAHSFEVEAPAENIEISGRSGIGRLGSDHGVLAEISGRRPGVR